MALPSCNSEHDDAGLGWVTAAKHMDIVPAGTGDSDGGSNGPNGSEPEQSEQYFNSAAFKEDMITIGAAVAVSLSIRT